MKCRSSDVQSHMPGPADQAVCARPRTRARSAARMCLGGLIGTAFVTIASAQAPDARPALEVAKKSGCLVCHGVDKKIVGPAWRDVGTRYAGDGAAADRLIAKIKQGGSGAWGSLAMPPHPQVSNDDVKLLVRYVLSLRRGE